MFDDTKLRCYPPFAKSLQGLQGKNGKGELFFPRDKITRKQNLLGFTSRACDVVATCQPVFKLAEECLTDTRTFLVDGVAQRICHILNAGPDVVHAIRSEYLQDASDRAGTQPWVVVSS